MVARADQAVILVGGLGSRLGSLTADTPKPLLPVAGRPFLEIQIEEIARQGVRRFLLLAAFASDQVRDFAAALPRKLGMDISVEIAIEPDRAGTGGAIWHARDRLDDLFFLFNGDSWFDIPLADVAAALPDDDGVLGVLSLRPLPAAGRYGVVTLDGDRIDDFAAAAPAEGAPALVNAGVYLFRRAMVERLEPLCSLERDTMPKLVAERALIGHVAEGYFLDIGIPADYARAQTEIPARRRKPALFLDRDGVINIDHGHVGTIDRFEWVEGAAETIRLANRLGFYVFVVTNQAGIGKGMYGEADYFALRRHIRDGLAERGAHIDDERHCPFHPEASVEAFRRASDRRKPEPGMIFDLLDRWPVDRARSLLIGDRESDLAAARAAGIEAHLFAGGNLADFARGLLTAGKAP
ncbi:HAD-IIIA family hydrolase [Zavarzinia compransoris]|uniref:HAD-IIIA family hydrolase n=1 Tax=Zavarzinia marina TaxID=2911065 RepID=UPI001F466EF6|nr:HAD-IIIA family hydrolase [Zavarzinia marina]MCF4167258.1 HAD-IIIA family hydrolase [Zavarzinia marina]